MFEFVSILGDRNQGDGELRRQELQGKGVALLQQPSCPRAVARRVHPQSTQLYGLQEKPRRSVKPFTAQISLNENDLSYVE